MLRARRDSGFSRLAVAAVLAAAALAPARAHAQSRVSLGITSSPAGASVYLDVEGGASLGITPIRRVRVTTGAHRFIFVLPGYQTATVEQAVDRRTRSVTAMLQQVATVDLSAANDTAEGARVRIDGQDLGALPYRGTVTPGRHLLQIGRAGYVTLSQWVEVSGGQVLTLPITLEQERPRTGSLLVAGDVSGAPVFVDGNPAGATPTVIENLTPGPHLVEIRPDGMPAWRDTVVVREGERVSVNPQVRPQPPPGGTLRVLSSAPNTRVVLDGEDIGVAPITRENVPPGQHILEGSADGFMPAQQTVEVTAGQQTVVRLVLGERPRVGRIHVSSSVPGAHVFVDGGDRGEVPQDLTDVAPGTHQVLVRAEGHADFTQSCTVQAGDVCEVVARPGALAAVQVRTNAPNARLLVDGTEVGALPYEGSLPVGEHTFRVEAAGYHAGERRLSLAEAATPRTIEVELRSEGPTPEELAAEEAARHARRTGASTHAGAQLVRGQSAFDISVGNPYLFEGRGTIGVLDLVSAGVDLRVLEADTSLRTIELGVRGHLGFRPIDAFSAGAEFEIHGATNFDNITGWGLSATVMGSLHFASRGAFTLRAALDVFGDSWDRGTVDNLDCGRTDRMCMAISEQTEARLRLGVVFDYAMSAGTSFFVSLDGIATGPDRILLQQNYFGIFDTDTKLYLRLGLTFKF